MAEGSKEISGPRPRRFQLWQDLRGKTGYRVFGALILDDLCRKADLSTAAMLRALRKELDRPLSRQSLAAWRRGDLATPNEVLLATYAVVGRTLAEPSLTVAMRVLADPDADPRFAERLRLYYGSGRAALPTERPSWFARAVGETKRRKRAAPGAAQPPPWRDLRGKTRYRMFGALILDELCRESDINAEELRRRLRRELRRPLSRQTLAAWRRGVQAVPNDVLIATAGIVHRTLGEASVVIAMRVLSDPAADRQFVEMLHAFYADRRE